MNKIEILEIFLAQNGKCFYCGLAMAITKNSPASFTKDHVKPRCKGNKLNGNTVLCHSLCNGLKGQREPTTEEKARFKALYSKINKRKKEIKMVARKYSKKPL